MSTPTIKDIRAAADARRRSRARRRRLIISVISAVVILTLGGLFGLPPLLKAQLQSRGAALLQRSVEIDQVSVNPFTLAITIQGMVVKDHDGTDLASWRRLRVDANLWSTLTGNWGADAIELEGFSGKLEIDVQGRLNIADIFEALPQETGESRPFDIERLSVTEAQLVWRDGSRAQPFETILGPVTFSLTDFHTQYDPDSPYQFEAVSESGESLVWDGTVSLSPLRSAGRFAIRGLRLPKYAAYLTELLPVEFRSGVLDVASAYEINWTDELLAYRLREGRLAATNLTLAAAGEELGAQSFGAFTVAGIEVDSTAREVSVEDVVLREGNVAFQRNPEGGVSWLGMEFTGSVSSPAASTASSAWSQALLQRVRLEQVGLRLRDHRLPSRPEVGFDVVSADVSGLDLATLSSPVEVALNTSLPLGGTATFTGSLVPQPFAPDVVMAVDDVALVAGAGHLKALSGLQVVRGAVSVQGTWQGQSPEVTFAGQGQVADLWVLDAHGEDLGGAAEIEVAGLQLALDSRNVQIGEVTLQEPVGYLRLREDGRWNFADPADRESSPEVTFEASPPTPMTWAVGEIELSGGQLNLSDDTLIRPATMSLDAVAGSLAGWSSREVTKAQVEISGLINGSAPVAITGDLNPLGHPAFADLTVMIDGAALQPLAGYVERYAGYGLAEGSMSLDIAFQLRDRAIQSETVTVLDRFTLGDKVPSPDATKLPVALGVALLKDAKGEIVIDVPVAGRLDDPEFRIGRVVWRVIANLLTKAATSPFALLGGAIGGGAAEADFEQHVFAPGSAVLSAAVIRNLDTLGEALQNRPQLGIEINGGYDPVGDGEALRPVVLEHVLRTRAPADRFDAMGAWRPHARAAMLVELFQAEFGEPPVDPEGELPPDDMAEPMVAAPPEVSVREAEDRSFAAWLRKVFLPHPVEDEPAAAPVEVAAVETKGSFPVPEGLATELPALPEEEIIRRLIPLMNVGEQPLRDLARTRAEAVAAYLRERGVDAGRLTVGPVSPGQSQVSIQLR